MTGKSLEQDAQGVTDVSKWRQSHIQQHDNSNAGLVGICRMGGVDAGIVLEKPEHQDDG